MSFISEARGVRNGLGRIWLVAVVICAVGCERIVSVTAPRSAPRLVVKARLEKRIGTLAADQLIRLTTTDDAFSAAAPPPAAGAIVRVIDSLGVTTTFTESATERGVFRAARMVLPTGRALKLQITWQGDVYEATETVLPGVPMDSLFFAPPQTRFDAESPGLRATIAARDPGNQRNHYLWDQYVDGQRLVSPDSESFSRAVVSDDLFDGGFIRNFQPYEAFGLRAGALVRVRQLSISERVYRFYAALSIQTSTDGSPFGVAASSVRGNVANISRPQQVALGYFSVGEFSELERTAP